MPCPLRRHLDAEGLDAADDTADNGNCGLSGFGISLRVTAAVTKSLYVTSKYKKFLGASKTPQTSVDHLRCVASKWMDSNADTVVWEGMSFKTVAVSMSGIAGRTYGDAINSVSRDREWVDCACFLALSCYFAVDTLILQSGADPLIVGCSLMGEVPLAMVTLAMVNDFHFWGLRAIREKLPTLRDENGDVVNVPAVAPGRDNAVEGADDDMLDMRRYHEEVSQPGEQRMTDRHVAMEMALCEMLRGWKPFDAPDADAIQGIQLMSGIDPPKDCSHRLFLRQTVIKQLEYDTAHAATLPDFLRCNAAARYRLRQNRLTNAEVQSQSSWAKLVVPSVEKLTTHLRYQKCCGPNTCRHTFGEMPQIVRNWRLLWLSRPPTARRESLLAFHVDDLRAHRARNQHTDWQVNYIVMGEKVCRNAFMSLTGIGVSSLVTARHAALDGKCTALSRKELGAGKRLYASNQENLYYDARQWLEHYADTHAEKSPIDCLSFLPCGRKQFYWHQYSRRADRGQPCFPKSTLVTSTFRWFLSVQNCFSYPVLILLGPQ